MAIKLKGKGKKIAISLVIVIALMMATGSITAGLFGAPWYEYALWAISCGYAVWFSRLVTQDTDESG